MTDEDELAALEEHYLGCPECAKRADEAADYVDAIRAGMVIKDFDLEFDERNRGRAIMANKEKSTKSPPLYDAPHRTR